MIIFFSSHLTNGAFPNTILDVVLSHLTSKIDILVVVDRVIIGENMFLGVISFVIRPWWCLCKLPRAGARRPPRDLRCTFHTFGSRTRDDRQEKISNNP